MVSTDYNHLIMTGSDPTDMRACVFPAPSLIQQLCPDILAEIFTFCLPEMPKEPWGVDSISSRNAPLLLCSVCSSWRSLAISTPRLWQTLQLGTTSDEKLTINIKSTTSGIRTWLDRSRALSLSIRACFWMRDPASDKAIKCRQVLEVLSEEISRWESFELDEIGMWATPPNFGILPILHTFDISRSYIDAIPFTAAPRLKRLGLYSLCPNPKSISAIPWDQLVELTIEEAHSISMVVEVIQCCHLLESLVLQIEEGDEEGSPTIRSITQHNTLRILHLKKLPYVNAITDHLALPVLTDLSLWSDCSTPEVEAKIRCSQLLAFFTRSNCELQEFALHHSEFGPGELLECLSHRSCQTLTHLVIYGEESSPPIVDRELIIRLTYQDVDDDVPLCPKLVHLELGDCYCPDESFPDLLGRMIQSRCFGRAEDARLRTLEILNCYSVSREDYKLLQSVQSHGGLDLRYSFVTARSSDGDYEDMGDW